VRFDVQAAPLVVWARATRKVRPARPGHGAYRSVLRFFVALLTRALALLILVLVLPLVLLLRLAVARESRQRLDAGRIMLALTGPRPGSQGNAMLPLRSMLLTSLLALTPMLASAADKVTTTPVHFTKGASSATLRGTLSGYETVRYTVAARAGQTMAVTIDGSPNANFNVFAPGVVPGEGQALGSNDENRRWSGTLPNTGTYVVQVYQMRAQARRNETAPHSVTVAIR